MVYIGCEIKFFLLFPVSNRRKCGINILMFLQSLHALAASVHHSMQEIDCFETMGRPGRPKRNSLSGFVVDRKIRIKELRRLKEEVLAESAQMTSMMNLLL